MCNAGLQAQQVVGPLISGCRCQRNLNHRVTSSSWNHNMNSKFQLWSCCPFVLGSLERMMYWKTDNEQTTLCCPPRTLALWECACPQSVYKGLCSAPWTVSQLCAFSKWFCKNFALLCYDSGNRKVKGRERERHWHAAEGLRPKLKASAVRTKPMWYALEPQGMHRSSITSQNMLNYFEQKHELKKINYNSESLML